MRWPSWTKCVLIAAILLVYFGQVAGRIYTRIPWVDEGFFGDPATTLLHHGYLGTRAADPNHIWRTPGDQQLGRYFFYLPPLYPITLAGWWVVVGYGLLAMRWLSAVFGVILLLSTYSLARSLTGNRAISALSAGLMVLDYHFITAAADGRMDCMGAALGFCGLALFLRLSAKQRKIAAVLVSHALVGLSILTHPNNLVFFPLLLLLMSRRQDLRWRNWLWLALPYVLEFGVYGMYVAQNPDAFGVQVRANLASRLYGPQSLGSLVVHELDRYYLYTDVRLLSDRLKTVLTLPLLGAFIALGTVPDLRRRYPRLLAMLGTGILFFSFFVGRKWSGYLVDLLPLYEIAFAIVIFSVRPRFTSMIAGVYVSGCLFFTIHAIYLDRYHKEFVPTLSYLRANAAPHSQLNAPPYFGFYWGFDRVHDDFGLGVRKVPLPNVIVYEDEWYRNEIREASPAVQAHVEAVLGPKPCYTRGIYNVYTCGAACQALIAKEEADR